MDGIDPALLRPWPGNDTLKALGFCEATFWSRRIVP
jgi:hypothetical protein